MTPVISRMKYGQYCDIHHICMLETRGEGFEMSEE